MRMTSTATPIFPVTTHPTRTGSFRAAVALHWLGSAHATSTALATTHHSLMQHHTHRFRYSLHHYLQLHHRPLHPPRHQAFMVRMSRFGEEKKRVLGFAKRHASKASFKRQSIDHVLEEKMETDQEGQSALWMSYSCSPKQSMEMENEMNEMQREMDRQHQTMVADDEAASLEEEWTPTCIEVWKHKWHLFSCKFRRASYQAHKRSRPRARSL